MRLNVGLTEHPEHAVRIAQIIASWNSIEDVCSQLLPVFLGTSSDQSVRVLHAIRGADSRLTFVADAGRYCLEGHAKLKEFVELMDRLHRIATKIRNPYVHNVYGVNDEGVLYILDRRFDHRETQKGGRPLHLKELDQSFSAIAGAFNAVLAFHNALYDDPTLSELISASHYRSVRQMAVRGKP